MKHLTTLAALACLVVAAQPAMAKKTTSPVDYVEPANWWVGMHHPTVQVMLHGQDISQYDVQLDNAAGAVLDSVVRTDNANYLFLDLDISSMTSASTIDIVLRSQDKKKEAGRVSYELREREAGSADRKGFDASDAIMLIMPDRFVNGDPTNDTVDGMLEKADRNEPYGRHGGDLAGIEQNLDYFVDLGMTALWFTPVLENDMPQSSYHGYAITDYYNIDRRLGTIEDFRRITDKCHERGLKMIMDMVFNHFGTSHKWMRDLPAKDWIFDWNGQYVNSNFRLSTVSDPHVAHYDQRITTEGWFDRTMADTNMRNPLMRNYLIQNSIWWIETIGLDGIRQDTYPYPDKEAMREWNLRVREEYPDFNIVGETWIAQASKLCYWQKDHVNADGYNSELPTIMDFALQAAIQHAFVEEPSWDGGMMRIYDVLADDHVYPNTDNLLIFGENHDVGRLRNLVGGSLAKLKLATALLATMRGIPQLYVGTEVGMTGDGYAGHCFIREDFAGGWEGDEQSNLTADKRQGEAAEMYDYTARLFRFRKTSKALQTGKLTHFMPRNEVYVYFREAGDETVMVVINNNKEQQKLDPRIYFEKLSGHASGHDIVSDQDVDLCNIVVDGETAMVVSLTK